MRGKDCSVLLTLLPTSIKEVAHQPNSTENVNSLLDTINNSKNVFRYLSLQVFNNYNRIKCRTIFQSYLLEGIRKEPPLSEIYQEMAITYKIMFLLPHRKAASPLKDIFKCLINAHHVYLFVLIIHSDWNHKQQQIWKLIQHWANETKQQCQVVNIEMK